jgi:hypothetical protein
MNFSLSHKMLGLVGIAFVGLLAFGATTMFTLRAVKVNGPLYAQIVAGKDLIADILPPPAYIIESKLTVLEMLTTDEANRLRTLEQRMTRLEKDFNARREYWTQNLGEGEMKTELLTDSARPAESFFTLYRTKFLPALSAGKKDEASSIALGAMEAEYVKHRAAIDNVVAKATAFASANESQAAAKRATAKAVARRAEPVT